MNTKSLFSLFTILLLLSVSCNLPILKTAINDLPEDDVSDALIILENYDQYFGVLETYDINSYGFPNVLYYTLPEEKVEDNIFMQQLYTLENKGNNGYRAGLTYFFRNNRDTDAYVEVIIDIPKEIAPTFDEMELTQPPLEIIESDPKGRFGFNLAAKTNQPALGIISNNVIIPSGSDPDKAFLDLVFTSGAKDLCSREFSEDEKVNREMQDMCYFNLVKDFKDNVGAANLSWVCLSIEDDDLANTCGALLQSDRQFCDQISDSINKERCLALLVNDACLDVPIENRELCIAEGALELKSFGACLEISEPDIKNDCIARVKNSKKYCDRIVDEVLKGQCYSNIGIREQDNEVTVITEESENPQESGDGLFGSSEDSSSGEDNGWFSEETADEVCATIASQIGMPYSEGHANIDHLLCNLSMDNGADGWPATVYIWMFHTEQDARTSWDSLSESMQYTKDISNQVYADHTSDSNLVVAQQPSYADANQWVFYIVANQVYKNGKIEYTHNSLIEDKRENWNYIVTVGQEFIDSVGTK